MLRRPGMIHAYRRCIWAPSSGHSVLLMRMSHQTRMLHQKYRAQQRLRSNDILAITRAFLINDSRESDARILEFENRKEMEQERLETIEGMREAVNKACSFTNVDSGFTQVDGPKSLEPLSASPSPQPTGYQPLPLFPAVTPTKNRGGSTDTTSAGGGGRPTNTAGGCKPKPGDKICR
jgi:hypothetical protein